MSIQTSVRRTPLRTRMLQGVAHIVFLTVFLALFSPAQERPRAQELAVVLIVGAIAGAAGGATYYLTDGWRLRGGWRKAAANIGTLLAYLAAASGLLVSYALVSTL